MWFVLSLFEESEVKVGRPRGVYDQKKEDSGGSHGDVVSVPTMKRDCGSQRGRLHTYFPFYERDDKDLG